MANDPAQPETEKTAEAAQSALRSLPPSAADVTGSSGGMATSLRWHTLVFVLLNLFIVTINLVFSPSVLWFLWVTGTWGMALVVHAFAVRSSSGVPALTARVSREAHSRSESRVSRSSGRKRSKRSRKRDARDEHDEHDEHESDAELGSAATRLSLRAPANPAPSTPTSSSGDSEAHLATQAHSDEHWKTHPRADKSSTLQVGQRLADRFVIERVLGAGGMGEVYLAHDAMLGEKVALKTITASSVSPAVVERFRREAQAARRITHPNVVRIHDIGQDGALSFISMEYVAGQTLAQHVDQQGQLPLAEVKRIALQLCAALQAAHAAGVVHRDLKPQNVLLDAASQVRVIDFGLARVESAAGLTATGTVMGTPHYMAPEQLMGQTIDARTDIYALGCVLHFLITAVPPFERDSAMAIGMAHCQEPPQSLVTRRRELSSAWDALVLRALQKLPEQRFQSASELQQALEAV